MDLGPVEETWNIKKIIIGIAAIGTVVGGGLAAKNYFYDQSNPKQDTGQIIKQDTQGVLGESDTQEKESNYSKERQQVSLPSVQNVKETVEQRIETIRQQIVNLSPSDVASSSPQVQRIIQDLRNLQQYPTNQAREMCENLCKSL